MPKSKPKEAKQPDSDLISTWKQRYAVASNNQQKLFKRFSQWFDLFYAGLTAENIAPWRSKVFIPILSSKGWNLIAKFVGLRPGFEVAIRDPDLAPEDAQAKQEKMQFKLDYDYNNPHLDLPIREKLIAPLLDAVVTGTGLAKVPWCTETEVKYKRTQGAGLFNDGTVDLSTAKKYESTKGYNDLIPVDIFNVFASPTAWSLQKAPWIIIKEFKTLVELKTEGVYQDLDKLKDARAGSDEFANFKQSRNRLLTYVDRVNADPTLDHIPIFECYERTDNGIKIITFAEAGTKDSENVWVKIREQSSPYWHGKFPLVKFTVKQRPHEFWGEGIFEVSHRLQSAINDVFNHYMDNWNLSIEGMVAMEEGSFVSDYVVGPGNVIKYREIKPEQFKFPEPNAVSLQIVMQTIEKAIEDVTVSNYATGSPNSSTDKTAGTATGILRLQAAAGDLISFMRSNFQQSVHQVGEMWLSNNQQFIDRPLTIAGESNGQAQNFQITPADLQGDMEVRIDDSSMEPLTKEERRNSRLAMVGQTLQLQQASEAQYQVSGIPPMGLDYSKILQDLANDFGAKNVGRYMIPPEKMAELVAQRSQMMAQASSAPDQGKLQSDLTKIQAKQQGQEKQLGLKQEGRLQELSVKQNFEAEQNGMDLIHQNRRMAAQHAMDLLDKQTSNIRGQ